jgi:CRP-like cAMP-binding protein
MARKPQVDLRALKDEVADHLKKSRWDKAAEVLEDLVATEPKDMAQRLKLGETYRKLGQPQKAIESYQHAAKFFADQGQLIKAIGAVKIVLEIDPRNPQALKQLAEMNERRKGSAVPLAKVSVKSRPAAAIPRPAPARPKPPPQQPGVTNDPRAIELPPDDEGTLELDDGRSIKTERPAPPAAERISASAVELPEDLDLDPAVAPPASAPPSASAGWSGPIIPSPPDGKMLTPELDPELSAQPADEPGAGEILSPEPEDLVPPEHEDDVIPGDEFGRQGGPIADLLSAGAEEEIELLSISADEEASGGRPTEPPAVSADDEDLDRAFGNIAPDPTARPAKVVEKKVPLFDDLPQEAFVALVNRLGYHRQAPGQVIIREGDPGHSFFIIVEGRVRVYKTGPDGKEITLAHLGEGAFFGEMALLSGAPRTANVVAEEETEILEVTDIVLRDLTKKHPQVVTSLKNFYRQRLLNNVMAISPLFRDFDPSQRRGIVEKFRMRQAAPGEMIIAEGKSVDGLYIVLHGIVQVSVKNTEVAKLKEGDIFGEMSLLTREPASATVTAQGNAILLRMPRESFQELVVTHPQILALVSELTEQRRSAVEAILQGLGEGHDGMSFV